METFPELENITSESLAKVAFKDENSQEKLNRIIHPAVGKEALKKIKEINEFSPEILLTCKKTISKRVSRFINNNSPRRDESTWGDGSGQITQARPTDDNEKPPTAITILPLGYFS